MSWIEGIDSVGSVLSGHYALHWVKATLGPIANFAPLHPDIGIFLDVRSCSVSLILRIKNGDMNFMEYLCQLEGEGDSFF